MSVPQSDEPVDIIRIRKFGGLDDAPSLKREIIQCLVGNKTVRYIHEVGLPDIPWTKSLPSSTYSYIKVFIDTSNLKTIKKFI